MAVKKLTDYTPAEKVNPYIEELKDIAVGDYFQVEVETKLSPTKGTVNGVTGETAKVRAAARTNGFTARTVEEETLSEATAEADGLVRIVFQAFKLQKSPERAAAE